MDDLSKRVVLLHTYYQEHRDPFVNLNHNVEGRKARGTVCEHWNYDLIHRVNKIIRIECSYKLENVKKQLETKANYGQSVQQYGDDAVTFLCHNAVDLLTALVD